MADQLSAIVQKMVDAGESDADIGAYIQHFQGNTKQYTPDSPLAHGLNKQEGSIDAEPSGLAVALNSAAHPQTLGDFAGLLAAPVDATRGVAGMLFSGAKRAISAGGRAAVNAGGAIADTLSPDAVGLVSPRAGNALRIAGKMRDALSEAPIEAPKSPILPQAAQAPVQAPASVASQLTPQELATMKRMGIDPSSLPAGTTVHSPSGLPPLETGTTPFNPAAQQVSKSPQQLLNEQAIAARRAKNAPANLASMLGTPSDADIAGASAVRNATGQWKPTEEQLRAAIQAQLAKQ